MENFNIEPDYERYVAPIENEGEAALPEDDFDAAAGEVIEHADGSASIVFDEDEPAPRDFLDNLATALPEHELATLARELLDDIQRDKQDRSKRDEQYAEGIKRTGLGNEAPGGAQFAGASRVVHPTLVEACIDFTSRAMKEIFPANGPCKAQIVGKITPAKQDKADRKTRYMNWQFTTQVKEARSELEQLLTQLPLGGSQYKKWWHDDRFERPRTEFVPIDDVLIPFAATDFYSAQRKTHVQKLTQLEFRRRIDCGLYREVEGVSMDNVGQLPEPTAAQQATDKIEGREDSSFNEDGLRVVYETYAYRVLNGDDVAVQPDRGSDGAAVPQIAPYIITTDETTGKILAIYRNWDPADTDKLEALDWMVEYRFFPWRGAYGIGLTHIIGGLSGAATGALRAILDSALIQNQPSAIKLKGARMSGQNTQVEPTGISEIEGPTGIDDIRKLAMPLPFPGPSATLFQLLGWLTEQAKGVVATSEEKIADANQNTPVGTTLALIEQGSQVFSAIHSRLHESQKRELAILHRLDAVYVRDEETIEELGDLVVRRSDFEGPMDVIPVSDPNIFSDAQRFAQNQAVLQLHSTFPDKFDVDELLRRNLRLMKYPDPEGVLLTPEEPEYLTAIEENYVAGEPRSQLKAYPEQDHLEHLKAHVAFMGSPIFCANPLMATPALGKLLEHCREHLRMLWKQHAESATLASATVAGASGGAQAEGALLVDQALAEELGPLMQPLQAAMKAAQEFGPKPPPDPTLAAVQAEITYRQGKDQAELAYKAQKDQLDRQAEDARAARREAAETAGTSMKAANDERDRRLQAENQARADREQARQHALDQRFETLRAEMANENKILVTLINKLFDEKAAAAEDAATVQANTASAKSAAAQLGGGSGA